MYNIDDMCDTFGTIDKVSDLLITKGAKDIVVVLHMEFYQDLHLKGLIIIKI